MARPLTLLPVLAAAVLVLAGCNPGASPSGGDSAGAGGSGDSGAASGAAAACAAVADRGYELFVDERLSVSPQADVYSLAAAGDTISFTDTPPTSSTYGYSRYYIDNETAFPNGGAIFVGAEDTGTFELTGPLSPMGVGGGPYPGIIEIEATSGSGTTVIARLCVQLAAG